MSRPTILRSFRTRRRWRATLIVIETSQALVAPWWRRPPMPRVARRKTSCTKSSISSRSAVMRRPSEATSGAYRGRRPRPRPADQPEAGPRTSWEASTASPRGHEPKVRFLRGLRHVCYGRHRLAPGSFGSTSNSRRTGPLSGKVRHPAHHCLDRGVARGQTAPFHNLI